MTLQVLKGAGAVWRRSDAEDITLCPTPRFCVLPTGERRVYGIDEIPHMTQIDVREIAAINAPGEPDAMTGADTVSPIFSGTSGPAP